MSTHPLSTLQGLTNVRISLDWFDWHLYHISPSNGTILKVWAGDCGWWVCCCEQSLSGYNYNEWTFLHNWPFLNVRRGIMILDIIMSPICFSLDKLMHRICVQLFIKGIYWKSTALCDDYNCIFCHLSSLLRFLSPTIFTSFELVCDAEAADLKK